LIDTTDDTKTYQLEILFTNTFADTDLGTNIADGNDFPYVTSSNLQQTSLKLNGDRRLEFTG
jgi:hypothetical protein